MAEVSEPAPAKPVAMPGNLPEFTSLRFFAALFVVLFHYRDNSPLLLGINSQLLHKGYLGVDVFFMLSGFILTHVYRPAYVAKRFSYRDFLINRFARVYPLHLAMIGAFLALYLGSARLGLLEAGEGMNFRHLPFHIAALHAWGFTNAHSWNFPSWSISAEFFAYLIFPFYLLVSRVRPWIGLALALVLFCGAYLAGQALGWRLTALMFNFGIARIFFEFLIGVFLCLTCYHTSLPARLAKPALAVAVAAFLALCHFGVSDMIIVLVGAAIIFLLGQLANSPKPWLMRQGWLVYLGEISYSTYMVHYFIQLVFVGAVTHFLGMTSLFPFWVWMWMLPIVYATSAVTYHLIERPARQFIRRWTESRASAAVASSRV